MILWDIVLRYNDDNTPRLVIKLPNGNPLPQDGIAYHWERAETAISEDEAIHLLNTDYAHITQMK